MNGLIQISNNKFNGSEVQTVNARELHAFLEVKTRFNDWINRRIQEYDFKVDVDFTILKNEYVENKEFFIAIDMAKELSMVERNEKGKQARQYFIECEKKAKNIQAAHPTFRLPDFENPAAAAVAWAKEYEEKQSAIEQANHLNKSLQLSEKVIETLEPEARAFKRISEGEGSVTPTIAAKNIGYPPSKIYDFMKDLKWVSIRWTGSVRRRRKYIALQLALDKGYLEQPLKSRVLHDGTVITETQIYVTAKGRAKMAKKLEKEAA